MRAAARGRHLWVSLTRAFLLLLAFGGPALAQTPPAGPRTRPSRDVVVTYRMDGPALDLVPGGVKGPVRLSWDAAGQRVRAEAEGRPQVALLDLRAHGGQLLDTGLRVVLPLPIREKDLQPLTLDQLALTPRGRETVAGQACTTYGFDTPQGPGTVCLTADGVPLQGQGPVQGRPGHFTALSVTYGRLPASLFEAPPGYMFLAGGDQSGLVGLARKLGGGSLSDVRRLLGQAR